MHIRSRAGKQAGYSTSEKNQTWGTTDRALHREASVLSEQKTNGGLNTRISLLLCGGHFCKPLQLRSAAGVKG